MVEIWTSYKVTWMGLTKLCGSVPADPELVLAWTEARAPKVRPAGSKSIDEIREEVFETIAAGEAEDKPEFSLLVFQRTDGVLVVRAATIRAHLKDCARVISAQFMDRIKGERAFSTRVINGLYPDEAQYWVPILRPNGTPITKHDGEKDKPIHVRGPRGETLNALKRYEFIEPWRLDFTLKVLGVRRVRKKADGKEEITEASVRLEDLEVLMTYGGVHGYAGERGDGEGRYTFDMQEVK